MPIRTHNLTALMDPPRVRMMSERSPRELLLEDISEHGLVVFDDDGLKPELLDMTWRAMNHFFESPLANKRRYERADDGHQRGYTPPRTEHARDQLPEAADLKEFWQEGPADWSELGLLPNVEVDTGFDAAKRWLHKELRQKADHVFRVIAPLLHVSPDWLVRYAGGGDDIVRFLRYFALRGHSFPPGTYRSAPHTDINLITLLKTRGKGLVVTTKSGERLELDIGPRQLVVQMGDMIEVLSGGLLPATVHWVENPPAQDLDNVRDSIALFTHPAPLRWIDILPDLRRTDHTWDPRTERSYTEERLIEIGILEGPPKFAHERVSCGYAAPPSPWVDHI